MFLTIMGLKDIPRVINVEIPGSAKFGSEKNSTFKVSIWKAVLNSALVAKLLYVVAQHR